jgi:hypothetical protein
LYANQGILVMYYLISTHQSLSGAGLVSLFTRFLQARMLPTETLIQYFPRYMVCPRNSAASASPSRNHSCASSWSMALPPISRIFQANSGPESLVLFMVLISGMRLYIGNANTRCISTSVRPQALSSMKTSTPQTSSGLANLV